MMPISPRSLTERELHEYVAEVESHDSQVTGIVGYFYRMYRAEVLARVNGVAGRHILEIGCGEGLMFDGTETVPVQMDVSMTRLRALRSGGAGPGRALRSGGAGPGAGSRFVLCADGYQLPFPDASFDVALLVAVLEHTREPWRVLAEARRVLRPGGRVIMVVPNDVTMSVGRLLLRKFPIRYPDHLTFTTPGRMRRWLAAGFSIREAFNLPFRFLPFAGNLYYFVVAEKR
jgi:ubiquinone/menaquinone biosynthesis C-methylase UbiE